MAIQDVPHYILLHHKQVCCVQCIGNGSRGYGGHGGHVPPQKQREGAQLRGTVLAV